MEVPNTKFHYGQWKSLTQNFTRGNWLIPSSVPEIFSKIIFWTNFKEYFPQVTNAWALITDNDNINNEYTMKRSGWLWELFVLHVTHDLNQVKCL